MGRYRVALTLTSCQGKPQVNGERVRFDILKNDVPLDLPCLVFTYENKIQTMKL